MPNEYDELMSEIRLAGFFTTSVEEMGEWDRITICAKRAPGGNGYCGNSFWITKLATGWFLGTWGGYLYRIPDESRLSEFCVRCLTYNLDDTMIDFEDEFKKQFSLEPVSGPEFKAITKR